MEQGDVAAPNKAWRQVYLLQIPGADLEGVVSDEDGLWFARLNPSVPDELHYWAAEFDTVTGAMAAVEHHIEDRQL